MKKMIKKGFSMIELLFVMVILASLASIAMPSMSSGTDSATLTSMRSDITNTMSLLQSKYVDQQDYKLIIPTDLTDIVAGEKGLSTTLIEGSPITLSKGNILSIAIPAAGTGLCITEGQGFAITISNPLIPTKSVTYNSCTDAKISTVTTNG